MIYLYRVYQFCIAFPLLLVITILASTFAAIGSVIGGQRFWGYWPACIWGKCFCALNLVSVTVKGRDNISKGTSYVFVANHQGAFDIFSIYGYLGHNFKWMMKASLRKVPFVGYACVRSGHIFVDRSSPSAIRRTMETAERQLRDGMSVVVFPEGARTLDGRMHAFKRGAYILATEFNLPVVPISIDGAYKVLPRTSKLPRPGHINIVIHRPILPTAEGHDMASLIEQSREAIASAIPEEQLAR